MTNLDEEAQKKQPLSSSLFYMWRCLLAVAWADGNCGPEETAYFAKVFDNLPRYYAITQAQRDTLADDLEAPHGDIAALLTYINDPDVRNMLIGFAEDLVMIDGVLDPKEEDILKKLKLWAQPNYDKEALQKEIHAFAQKRRQENEAERQALHAEIRHMNPLFNAVDRLLMKLGIDVVM